ncbi:MAG: hypothetical protein ACREJX_13385, partial [Polyangiaceae bacterium]
IPVFDCEWLALPLSARGLVEELARVVDEAGSLSAYLADGADARAVGNELARLLCAHRNEYARVRRDTACLLEGGLISVAGSRISLHARACRVEEAADGLAKSTSAKRMRLLREREKAARGDALSPSHVTLPAVTSDARSDDGDASHVTRSLSFKDQINLTSPQESPPKPRRRGHPIPPDLQLTDERRAKVLRAGLHDPDRVWEGFVRHYRETGQRRPNWDRIWCDWVDRQVRWKHERPNLASASAPIVQGVDLDAPWLRIAEGR